MRPIRAQSDWPRTLRIACAHALALLPFAVTCHVRQASAQHHTLGDQLNYYGTGPTPRNLDGHPALTPYGDTYPADIFAAPSQYYAAIITDSGREPADFIRLQDDVNTADNNGLFGSAFSVDPITGQVSVLTDFDDIHHFDIGFDRVGVYQGNRMRSFNVATVYWLYEEDVNPDEQKGRTAPPQNSVAPRFTRFAANRRNDGFGFAYGYSELAVHSTFGFEADGGILGPTSSDTQTRNWVTGPQAGVVAFKRFGPLTFYAHALAAAGFNNADINQTNSIGQELVPGATNRMLYAQPTRSEHGAEYETLTPTGSLWLESGLQLTENTSLKFAWAANYVDNVLLAEDRLSFYLPDMGLVDPGNQHIFLQNFYCGIEMLR